MKNSARFEKETRTTFRAATCGAVVFVMIDLGVVFGYRVWGRGTSGDFWPDTFLGLLFLIDFPASVLASSLGIEHTDFANTYAFGLIVNGLLGATVFAVVSLFWQFVVKGDPQK